MCVSTYIWVKKTFYKFWDRILLWVLVQSFQASESKSRKAESFQWGKIFHSSSVQLSYISCIVIELYRCPVSSSSIIMIKDLHWNCVNKFVMHVTLLCSVDKGMNTLTCGSLACWLLLNTWNLSLFIIIRIDVWGEWSLGCTCLLCMKM